MFNFAGITHVIDNPSGHAPGYNFSLVGSVPVSMMEIRPATSADVMAGRAYRDDTGALVAPKGRKWETVDAILAAAKENGVRMCSNAGCSCRKLFTPEVQ
jgi:tripartite-type tricarboxylate transporter receptor subunit TctC